MLFTLATDMEYIEVEMKTKMKREKEKIVTANENVGG